MTAPVRAVGPAAPVAVLLAAFAGALAVRVALAGAAGASSPPAAVVFAAALTLLAVVCGSRAVLSPRVVVIGAASAAVLVLPALARSGLAMSLSPRSFPSWAVLTAFVATAEEAFLRGALFDAVERRWNAHAAVVIAAVAFAGLHVPFYGWHVVPVDLAVGVVLGAARLAAGTWTAPAIAHAGADLAGWWLL
jgi:membrane protease YdiL (CAAX protease family)